jgi:hypothetical protein
MNHRIPKRIGFPPLKDAAELQIGAGCERGDSRLQRVKTTLDKGSVNPSDDRVDNGVSELF